MGSNFNTVVSSLSLFELNGLAYKLFANEDKIILCIVTNCDYFKTNFKCIRELEL